MEEKEFFEQVMNAVYPGLTHYVRDVDLDEKIINSYEVNDIIYERGFIDCTSKIGGITKKVRYSIFSSNCADLSEHENGTNWKLHVIKRDSAFKVLDVFKSEDKVLITLLHIPLEVSDIFKTIHVNLDDTVIEQARKRFKECLNSEPVAGLDEEWYKRLSFPIGISDAGEKFPKPNFEDKK